MAHSAAEKEAIGLCIVWEAIGEMANHVLLQVSMNDDSAAEAEIRFHTREHQQLFLVRLLDFVTEKGTPSLTGVDGSCLDVLRATCATKAFDVEGSAGPLERAVESFTAWLAAATPLRLWLPTLDIDAHLTVPRHELLFVVGNQSKHNLSRLTGVSRRIAEILRGHGHVVPIELIPLALDDFRQHLQEVYFVYYGTWIAEHLTTIHWGIQNYLLPTFREAYLPAAEGEYKYSYVFPTTVTNEVAREWFWRLMNHVRSGPYIQPFFAPRYMKEEVIQTAR